MKIMFVGDVSLGEHYFSFGHGPRTYYQNQNIFSSVEYIFQEADHVIGNLEGPISDLNLEISNPESWVFRGDPHCVNKLKKVGFSGFSLANNHIVQHGEPCFNETIRLLTSEDITPLGLSEQAFSIFEKDGVKIGILSCSNVIDNTNINQKSYMKYNLALIKNLLKNIRDEVDWTILIIHWGDESSAVPTAEQKEQARVIHEAGINIIIGHHPHIVYEIEQTDTTLTAYSLGNFVFDLPWDYRLLETAILDIKFNKKRFDAKIWKAKIDEKHTPIVSDNSPVILQNGINHIYQYEPKVSYLQVKKLGYFLKNFFKGKSHLKYIFIKNKLINRISKKLYS
jgi:poly-gamma-glutamate capsule biosynthesis protein CapA/YwtB (metallophosphatase superfamily)